MENYFIQMAASASHAVAYTIGPIWNTLSIGYSCIQLMASRILSFKASIVSGTSQMMVQRCQIVAPRWQNDISSAADNAIFKNRTQNIECNFYCVARSADLLKSNVANILLFNFCEQKFVPHGPITIAIDCNGLILAHFRRKMAQLCLCTKIRIKQWRRFGLFNVCMLVFCAPNAIILLVYIPAKIKMSFIWKDDFFCQNRHLL